MKVIGLCGSSGSGKSTVCRFLSAKGVKILDCDVIYHEMINKPSPCLDAIGAEFGQNLILNGVLDRASLREIVFSDPKKIKKLNEITHRFVKDELKVRIQNLRNENVKYCIIDAPMFFEAKLDLWCDFICAVIAKQEIKIERICARDKITVQQAQIRLNNQISDQFLVSKADFVIENNSGKDDLVYQCEKMLIAIEQQN